MQTYLLVEIRSFPGCLIQFELKFFNIQWSEPKYLIFSENNRFLSYFSGKIRYFSSLHQILKNLSSNCIKHPGNERISTSRYVYIFLKFSNSNFFFKISAFEIFPKIRPRPARPRGLIQYNVIDLVLKMSTLQS